MIRTFIHQADLPSVSSVIGPEVDLDVTEIEYAGIREVLQTPGASYGTWSMLHSLLAPTGCSTPFVFQGPLGQAREVKVALSGLFGRFVARAYLERYCDLSIFAHLGNRTIDLDRRRNVTIQRLSSGDLPDWIACAPDFSSLTVAEAKGSHDPRGPAKSLARAMTQACRINVMLHQRTVPVSRISIATRWGMQTGGPAEPYLSVRGMRDKKNPIEPHEWDALFIGMLRLHIANLIRPLGYAKLAAALCMMTRASDKHSVKNSRDFANEMLSEALVAEVSTSASINKLIGGIVTRGGPLMRTHVTLDDQVTLERLSFRPLFVGVEHSLIDAAINAEPYAVRAQLKPPVRTDDLVRPESPDDFARRDGAGGWMVPLGKVQHIMRWI